MIQQIRIFCYLKQPILCDQIYYLIWTDILFKQTQNMSTCKKGKLAIIYFAKHFNSTHSLLLATDQLGPHFLLPYLLVVTM